MIVKFSQKFISDLTFSQKRLIYVDTNCKYLTIHSSINSIKFSYDRKYNYKNLSIKLGDVKDFTYKQIILKVQQINLDIANGTFEDKKEGKTNSITFYELWQNYINHKNTVGHSQDATKRTVSRFNRLIPCNLQNAPAKSIKGSELEKIILEIAKSSERVATLLVAELKAAFNYHIKINDDISKNPCLNLTKFKINERSRFLSQDELKRFFTALELCENQDFKDFIKIAIFTGKRKSNVLSMQWQEIDFTAKTWTIPKIKNKSKIEDVTILDDVALDILKKRKNSQEFVFYSPKSTTKHYTEPKTAWKTLLKNANIQDLRIHDLRRTLASVLAGQNVSLHMIANILGQSSTGATPIYARFADTPKREALSSAVNEIAIAGGLIIDPVNEAYKRILSRLKGDNDLILTLDRLLKNQENLHGLTQTLHG